MIPSQKNKMNLKILEMLRDKGAPAVTPFPGEQGFEAEDLDLDQMGDVLVAKGGPAAGPEDEKSKKKKKKPAPPAEDDYRKGRTKEEIESSFDFVPADEAVQIHGVN